MDIDKKKVIVEYSAEDRLTPQLSTIATGMGKVDNAAASNNKAIGKSSTAFSKLAKSLGGLALAYKAVSYGNDAIKMYKQQELASKRLETIAKGVANATTEQVDSLKALAAATQETTTYGNELIEVGQSQILSYRVSAKQAEQLTGSLTDLMASTAGVTATEGDALNAANMLGKALTGQAGAMTRAGIVLTDYQKDLIKTGDTQTRVDTITQILADNYGGLAQELANTETGGIQQKLNAVGDLKEKLGKDLLPLQASWVEMQLALTKALVATSPVLKVVTGLVSGLFGTIGDILGGNKVALSIAAIAGAILLLPSALTLASTGMAAFNTVVAANPLGAMALAVGVAMIALNKLGDAIVDNMSKTADASGSFAGATAKEYDKVATKLQQYQDIAAEGNFATQEEIKLKKKLAKELRAATGHKVLFNIATGEATLENKWEALSVEDVIFKKNQQVKIEARVAAAKAKQTETAEEAVAAEVKATAASTKAAEAKAKAEANYLKNKAAAIALATSIQKEFNLNTRSGYEKERYIVEENYNANKETLLRYYSEGSEELKTLEDKRLQELKTINDKEVEEVKAAELEKLEAQREARRVNSEEIREAYALEEQLQQERTQRNLTFIDMGLKSVESLIFNSNKKKEDRANKGYKNDIDRIKKSNASEEDKAKKIDAIENKMAGEKHKRALADWRTSLTMSIVNTGLGITKTMATMGYPAGIPFSIALGVQGAINTGIIASNKPQKMQEGGVLKANGSTISDDTTFKGNGGERIISKGRTRKLDRLIDTGELGAKSDLNVSIPITVQGDATEGALNALANISNEVVDAVVRALEVGSEQGKIDSSRFNFAGAY